jgi:hypothetical protein
VIAAAINDNTLLAGLGITVVARNGKVLTNGEVQDVAASDPGLAHSPKAAPALPVWGRLALVVAILAGSGSQCLHVLGNEDHEQKKTIGEQGNGETDLFRHSPRFRIAHVLSLMVLAQVLLPGLAEAGVDIVASHVADNDPVTEGWTVDPDPPPVGQVGPISEFGFDAWFVDDNLTGSSDELFYAAPVTTAQFNLGQSFGWTLRARVRVLASGAPSAVTVRYNRGLTAHRMFIERIDADTIRVDFNILHFVVLSSPGFADQYHLYELVWDPKLATATLFVDGAPARYGVSGVSTPPTQREVILGSTTGTGTGRGHYNLVELTVNNPLAIVRSVDIDGGVPLLIREGGSFDVMAEVEVEFVSAFSGPYQLDLVDADRNSHDILGSTIVNVNVAAGEKVTITVNATLSNSGGVITGTNERAPELAVAADGVDPEPDQQSGRARVVEALDMSAPSKTLNEKAQAELLKLARNQLVDAVGTAAPDTKWAGNALKLWEAVQKLRAMGKKQTGKDLLKAYARVLSPKTSPQERELDFVLFFQKMQDTAGIDAAVGTYAALYSLDQARMDALNTAAQEGLTLPVLQALAVAIADPDTDGDTFDDEDELLFGSDPNDINSVPEHATEPASCTNGVDDDGDGLMDLAEADGPDFGSLPDCPDPDGDGVVEFDDNCPNDANPMQTDSDGDGAGDACDELPADSTEAFDSDGDGIGDGADPDDDNDGVTDLDENMFASDPLDGLSTPEDLAVAGSCTDELDNDLDDTGEEPFGGIDLGDSGCGDSDGDGVPDARDNCTNVANAMQDDNDVDGAGDVCDDDDDNDLLSDVDEGTTGTDPLDPDTDGDCMPDGIDTLPLVANPEQSDQDGDGFIDRCDVCYTIPNPDQSDDDEDWFGDACDPERGNLVWLFGGVAQGGSVQFSIGGVGFNVMTTAGESAAEVAANIAAAVNGDQTLSAAQINVQLSGPAIFSFENAENLVITDPGVTHVMEVPALGRVGYVWLGLLLLAGGAAILAAGRPRARGRA